MNKRLTILLVCSLVFAGNIHATTKPSKLLELVKRITFECKNHY